MRLQGRRRAQRKLPAGATAHGAKGKAADAAARPLRAKPRRMRLHGSRRAPRNPPVAATAHGAKGKAAEAAARRLRAKEDSKA